MSFAEPLQAVSVDEEGRQDLRSHAIHLRKTRNQIHRILLPHAATSDLRRESGPVIIKRPGGDLKVWIKQDLLSFQVMVDGLKESVEQLSLEFIGEFPLKHVSKI